MSTQEIDRSHRSDQSEVVMYIDNDSDASVFCHETHQTWNVNLVIVKNLQVQT